MGKSAKLHKRVKKVKSGASGSTLAVVPVTESAQAQAAKKRATLKGKIGTTHSGSASAKGGVLGGADYVALMMGSRKQARQEAKKLPKSEGST